MTSENDLQTLLQTCADEPIRIPGAIQPHGVLLTLDEASWTVQQVSANAGSLLGIAPQVLAGQNLSSWLGDAPSERLRTRLLNESLDEINPISLHIGDQTVEGVIHRHDDLLFIELEPTQLHAESVGLDLRLTRVLRRLQSAKTLSSLYEISVNEIRALTGYDRVLIYRFQEEGHGQVIAESANPELEAYQGLFFPASDIPEQARELYRLNWLRIIPDAGYVPVPMVPALRPDNGQPLDMAYAVLRSVSPIHCQYMHNMGVRSSMSISLLKDDQLWGLISCGNRQPLRVPHALRAACETIGQVLSMQISALEELHAQRQRQAKAGLLTTLAQAMADADGDVYQGLIEHPEDVSALANASGFAVVIEDQVHRFGDCPTAEQVKALQVWVQQQPAPVVATASLGTVFAPAQAYSRVASGLLAFSLPKPVENAVLWFRSEQKGSVQWSGNPDASKVVVANRLQPRESFEVWKQQVDGTALQWDVGDVHAVTDLRRSALESDLSRQVLREKDAVRARDELVAVVSHDLRSPLTAIVMQCGMMQRLIAADVSPASKRLNSAIDTLQRATARMTRLMEDLLDTSTIEAGRYSISPQALEISQLFEDAWSLLTPLALNKFIDLTFSGEPHLKIMADPERMFQVLSNLVGNAIKFTPKDGLISVTATLEGEFVAVSIVDSGAGIAPDQLPHVFERYWRIREGNPSGTGLGLYISQGIVKAHGGELTASSALGVGSVFRFTVPVASPA
ncbi:Bacteriophytochrome (light-regulated signal transduction histidine kinase) [Pseudomonas sp. NFACC02]|uniref:ATP-binding protein n=1 Tax=Pseudomonas sp. NFACC02 TaxID=1566250 RepID=UPI0008BDC66E|nr:ATP-binding protein [Pseudomonas sp. NFACC02]SEQ11874.1 Bacteriophytochrome (light-regulated signal transduction histidine kinase) [Pseudomonas sp. NFACC02]